MSTLCERPTSDLLAENAMLRDELFRERMKLIAVQGFALGWMQASLDAVQDALQAAINYVDLCDMRNGVRIDD